LKLKQKSFSFQLVEHDSEGLPETIQLTVIGSIKSKSSFKAKTKQKVKVLFFPVATSNFVVEAFLNKREKRNIKRSFKKIKT
jgi:hypothetical protein